MTSKLKMAEAGRRLLLLLSVLASAHFAVCHTHFGNERLKITVPTQGEPWPYPQSIQRTAKFQTLDQNTFRFVATGKTCDILEAAFVRYFKLIFRPDRQSTVLRFRPRAPMRQLRQIQNFEVMVQDPCEQYPSLEMDESYTLTAGSAGNTLTSKSVWGALRGLETLSQIIYQTGEGTRQVNDTTINDFPRFGHRGILLDTSRHYLAKGIIMENLEAMAQNKFNVFHWHIVDDPSFPYQSTSFPDLSTEGAYDPNTHIYTQADIKEIIEFARMRGIRVVPEFDTPGHTQSWGKGQTDLLTKCYSSGAFNGNYGPIDPTVNSTYAFLTTLLKELTGVFPDKYLHLGGDEVSFSCWQSNPDVTKFMQKMGFGTDYSKLEQYYEQNVLDIINSLGTGTGYIIWQEVVDNGVKVKPDTVVQVWKGGYQQELAKVTKMGLRTMLSSCWYLDYISYGSDWKKYYTCDPQAFNGTAEQKKLVMGGEACLWGELVDGSNVVSRLWPRASAIAERLWSADSLKDPNAALPRFEGHRCRMVRRGINAEPQNGPSFCPYEVQG